MKSFDDVNRRAFFVEMRRHYPKGKPWSQLKLAQDLCDERLKIYLGLFLEDNKKAAARRVRSN